MYLFLAILSIILGGVFAVLAVTQLPSQNGGIYMILWFGCWFMSAVFDECNIR